MSNPGIFLIQPNGDLVEMNEEPYNSEDLLQTLLAKYPSLLAGNQIDPQAPRKWLFIERESGVPSKEGAGGRWSADHLFLDQDAVPTIVEVKRSSDTRIRREVVGQMLDYAANAVVYWPADRLRERFAKTHGASADEKINEFLDGQMEPDEFWQLANKNLQDRKVRLLFVADQIPTELQRIVEFLNEQMKQTQVLAVEIKQFIGEGQTGLVPRVIGQTAEAITNKPPSPERSQEGMIEWIRQRSPIDAEVAQQILDWSAKYPTRVRCVSSGFYLEFQYGSGTFSPISVGANNLRLYVLPRRIKETAPFNVEENWHLFRRSLDELPVSFPDSPEWSSVNLSAMRDKNVLRKFLDIIDWSIEQVHAAHEKRSIVNAPKE